MDIYWSPTTNTIFTDIAVVIFDVWNLNGRSWDKMFKSRNWKFKNKSKTCLIKNESCQVCLIVSVSIRTSWLLLSEVIKELCC
jgi:hypothetical protein